MMPASLILFSKSNIYAIRNFLRYKIIHWLNLLLISMNLILLSFPFSFTCCTLHLTDVNCVQVSCTQLVVFIWNMSTTNFHLSCTPFLHGRKFRVFVIHQQRDSCIIMRHRLQQQDNILRSKPVRSDRLTDAKCNNISHGHLQYYVSLIDS